MKGFVLMRCVRWGNWNGVSRCSADSGCYSFYGTWGTHNASVVVGVPMQGECLVHNDAHCQQH